MFTSQQLGRRKNGAANRGKIDRLASLKADPPKKREDSVQNLVQKIYSFRTFTCFCYVFAFFVLVSTGFQRCGCCWGGKISAWMTTWPIEKCQAWRLTQCSVKNTTFSVQKGRLCSTSDMGFMVPLEILGIDSYYFIFRYIYRYTCSIPCQCITDSET